MKDLTHAELVQHLSYCPETGIFIRKQSHQGNRIGRQAGGLKEGYVMIKINRQTYGAHRLAWLYVHKCWPDGVIDHINRNPSDNRLLNLRVASVSENRENSVVISKSNTSGHRGVSWNKRQKKWHAKITAAGVQRNLGFYDEKQDAANAYLSAVDKYHTHNPLCGVVV